MAKKKNENSEIPTTGSLENNTINLDTKEQLEKLTLVLHHSKILVSDLQGIFVGGIAAQSIDNLIYAINELEKIKK